MENGKSQNNLAETSATQNRAAKDSRTQKVYAGMWGIPEIVAVTIGALSLLGVLLFYFFSVRPASKQIVERSAQRERIDQELKSAAAKFGDIKNTEKYVDTLIASVGDFENKNLRFEEIGRTSLYQRLNNLIAGYGLVNTSGPDYDLLTLSNRQEQPSEAERGRARFQSLYPGIYVTMTVEGTYGNLRRFIRELETSRDFVVISTVELQSADRQKSEDAKSEQSADSDVEKETVAKPRGKTRGEIVSLHLELAAYFRRGNS